MSKLKLHCKLESEDYIQIDTLDRSIGIDAFVEGKNTSGVVLAKAQVAELIEFLQENYDSLQGESYMYRVSFWFEREINPYVPAKRIVIVQSDKLLTDKEATVEALKKVGTYPKTYSTLVQRLGDN